MKKLSIRKPVRKDKKVTTQKKLVLKKLSFKQGVSLAVLATVLLFGASGYYWYTNVLTNPDRILAGMLQKSLQTTSVNRTITQEQGDSNVSQVLQTQFSPNVITKSVINLNEINDLGRTTVVTETIGTKTEDFVRYTDISIDNPQNKRDFSGVLNTWGARSSDPQTQQEVTFLNTALFVAVPFGNLTSAQRAVITQEIEKQNLYDYTDAKISYVSGRPVMNFSIDLSPKALVTVLAKYVDETGVGSKTDLDPATYEGVSAIKIKMQVDVLSRHVRTIEFTNSGRTESYQAYNPESNLSAPDKTIDVNELQKRLSEIESNAQ